MDLNQFAKWAAESPSRAVTIEINKGSEKGICVWAFDFDLMTGQFASSVDEIDLQAEKDRKDREEYEALRKRFEGGKNR